MLVAVLVLSGCTTRKIDKPVTGEEAVAFARNGPEPGYGILVGSFAYSGHHPSSMAKMLGSGDFRYNRYGFLFRSIEEETATYIGEVKVLHRFAKNTFGMYIPGGGYFVFDDSSERDLDLLKEKFSFLSDYPMRHAPLTNPDLPQPEEPEQSDSGQQEG